MKKFILSILLTLFSLEVFAGDFIGRAGAIPEKIKKEMLKYSWREGCPIPLKDLRYVEVSYKDFAGQEKIGSLITHKKIAENTIKIFKILYQEDFPIHSIKLIYEFEGSDDASMDANNTSAFNCRPVAGKTDVFSNHSYGIAIDINPIQNPYLKGKVLLPKSGKPYLDRENKRPGMIFKNDKIYKSFIDAGFIWGGEWNSLKDYHHFEYPKSRL